MSDINDSELVERAVRNAGLNTDIRRRFVAVMDTFDCDSETAKKLCNRVGLNPEGFVGEDESEDEED